MDEYVFLCLVGWVAGTAPFVAESQMVSPNYIFLTLLSPKSVHCIAHVYVSVTVYRFTRKIPKLLVYC